MNDNPKFRTNPLHYYKNVGYTIYLARLTAEEQKSADLKTLPLDGRVIACSRNLVDSSLLAPEVKDLTPFELLIGDVSFKTSPGTQKIEMIYRSTMSMEIFEPNGSALLEIMLAINNRPGQEMKGTQAPYLVVIKWHGYLQQGDKLVPAEISEFNKYVCVRMVDIKSQLTASGTRHSIVWRPYAQFLNDENPILQPMTLNGKTVKELLSSLETQLNLVDKKVTKEFKKEDANDKNPGQRIFHKIISKINEDILNSSILYANQTLTADKSPTLPGLPNSNERLKISQGENTIQVTTERMTVPQLIKEIILNCEWYRKNLLQQEDQQTQTPLKIVPKIYTFSQINRPWDPAFNDATYQQNYVVIMSESINYGSQRYNISQSSVFEQITAYKKKRMVRDYDYLFTGRNMDILDLDIKYNWGFYHKALLYNNKYSIGSDQRTSGDATSQPPPEDPNWKGGENSQANAIKIDPASCRRIPGPVEPKLKYSITRPDPENFYLELRNQLEMLYDSFPGEFNTVNMTIVGDPCWFGDYNDSLSDFVTSLEQGGDSSFLPVGEFANINFAHDAIIRIKINRPTAVTPNGEPTQFKVSKLLSRFYIVYMITHNFSNGKFTQVLDGRFVPASEYKGLSSDQYRALTEE